MRTVSIIVPVYNAEKYLPACLRSILRQSYRSLEVILVNDGSKDGSLAVCKKFAAKDSRVRVIDIPNGGVSNARNTGVAAATGEYVQFVDSDDLLAKNMTEVLVRELEKDAADLAVCGHKQVFVQKNGVKEKRYACTGERCLMAREAFLEQLPTLVLQGGMECVWNKLYRRSMIIAQNAIFPTDTSYGEDYLFNIPYFAACSRVVFLTEPLYCYMHYGQQSLSRKCPPDRYANQMRLVDALQDMLEQQIGLTEAMRQELARYRAAYLYELLSLICAEDNDLNREQKLAQLHTLLENEIFQKDYFVVQAPGLFAQQVQPFVHARDAEGLLQMFDDIRARMRKDEKRPVTLWLVRKCKAYSEKYPDSRLGKAAHVLYLNFATVGIKETLRRVFGKLLRRE